MKSFAYRKSVQVLNYFAEREGGTIETIKALKLLWLADRLHLRTYARTICGDNYYAMEKGVVASLAKDLAQNTDFLEPAQKIYSNAYLETHDNRNYASVQATDNALFSETDLDILSKIYTEFGDLDSEQLSELSHKYPEWKKFESLLNDKQATRAEMNYLDFFENPLENDTIFNQSDDYLAMIKEIYIEEQQIAQLV
jgi:uncharacterized phage-associated protein